MNKWILACFLIGFCSLLFVAGTFVGYVTSEESAMAKAPKKTKRVPMKNTKWTVQSKVNTTLETAMKTRIPSSNAINLAHQY